MSDRDKMFLVGANWTSNDGKRNVVIDREVSGGRDRTFILRNVATGRSNRIELPGLTRKYCFTGYDPEYVPA